MIELEHATALIRAFIIPERRERYLALLASPRGRAKLRRALAHLKDLDPRYSRAVPSDAQTPAGILELLRARGAPSVCVLLSEDASLDGRELPLDEALVAVVGRGMAAFISCVPGQLAYFEAEGPSERYVLQRRPTLSHPG